MPTKYDTNPLDPEFPEKAKAAAAAADAQVTQSLPYNGPETRTFPKVAATEEQTRRFAPTEFSAYPSPYSGHFAPVNYQGAAPAEIDRSSSRKVDKIGLPENVLTAVPYIPWYLGMVAGIILLLLLPKSETKVRFHAAQGLAAHIGIFIVSVILGIIGNMTNVAEIGQFVFGLVTSIMLVVFAIKAWQAKPVHIESVSSLTNWLEEKIKPVKSD
jgi:uncharacterized membrane protein